MSAESVEVRLTKLEADMRRIESVSEPRFARIEEALKPLATKAELADLRSEMYRGFADVQKGFAGVQKELASMSDKLAGMSDKMVAQTNRFIGYTLAFVSFAVSFAAAVVKILGP